MRAYPTFEIKGEDPFIWRECSLIATNKDNKEPGQHTVYFFNQLFHSYFFQLKPGALTRSVHILKRINNWPYYLQKHGEKVPSLKAPAIRSEMVLNTVKILIFDHFFQPLQWEIFAYGERHTLPLAKSRIQQFRDQALVEDRNFQAKSFQYDALQVQNFQAHIRVADESLARLSLIFAECGRV